MAVSFTEIQKRRYEHSVFRRNDLQSQINTTSIYSEREYQLNDEWQSIIEKMLLKLYDKERTSDQLDILASLIRFPNGLEIIANEPDFAGFNKNIDLAQTELAEFFKQRNFSKSSQFICKRILMTIADYNGRFGTGTNIKPANFLIAGFEGKDIELDAISKIAETLKRPHLIPDMARVQHIEAIDVILQAILE